MLVAGVGDLRSLPLAPVDGFILSRVNGTLTTSDIAVNCGLDLNAVDQSLEKLKSLGIIEFAGDKPALPPPAAPEPPKADAKSARLPPDAPSQGPPPYDPRELDEDCDLDLSARRRVLDLFYRLDDLDFYEVIGVPRTAEKKAIKRAYFELASHFHPDKFFRKNIGSFKSKMEKIFGRITEAHDTLTDKQRRPEYDEYLELQAKSRGIEAMMTSANVAVQRAKEERDAPIPAQPDGSRPPPNQSGIQARMPSSPDFGAAKVKTDPKELREALARRLTGGMPPRAQAQAKAASGPPPTVTYANPQNAMDALKRRYEDRKIEGTKAQAKKYRDAGDAARAKNDPVGAASAYRVAASFMPEDAELQQLAQEAQTLADGILADNYLKQAQYEERSAHWPEAARSWAKVVKGKPNDPVAHDRLANALVHSEGDLHVAADAAKRAIELSPNSAPFRVTLVNVYLAARLNLAARKELDAVLKTHPDNAAAQALLKRMQKGA
jgi:curved DNA-binding protein CbpA